LAGFLVDGPGLTVAFGAEVALLALGAILFFVMPSYPPPSATVAQQSVREGLAEGIRYARRTPIVPGLMFLVMVPGIFFAGPMNVNMVILVEDVLHASDKWIGIIFVAFGVGIMINLTVLTFWTVPRRGLLLAAMPIFAGVVFVGFGLSEDPYLSAFMMGLLGLGAGVFMGFAISLLQENVVDEMMGRVMSMYTLGFTIAIPIGLAQAGLVTNFWGPQVSLVASGIAACILGTLGLILVKPVRGLP
jgi:predicted MFS family arabinose efflux permease